MEKIKEWISSWSAAGLLTTWKEHRRQQILPPTSHYQNFGAVQKSEINCNASVTIEDNKISKINGEISDINLEKLTQTYTHQPKSSSMLYHQGILNDLKVKVSDKETVSIGNTYRNQKWSIKNNCKWRKRTIWASYSRIPSIVFDKIFSLSCQSKKYPKIPISASETNFIDSWATTNRGQRFLVKKISKKIKL